MKLVREIVCDVFGMATHLLWQSSDRLERVQNPIGVVFALLYIGLVEGMDPEHMPGDRRCKFPSKKLGPEIIAIAQVKLQDWVLGLSERLHSPIERPVLFSFEFEIDKETVGSIGTRL